MPRLFCCTDIVESIIDQIENPLPSDIIVADEHHQFIWRSGAAQMMPFIDLS
jgi:hypothetical protein